MPTVDPAAPKQPLALPDRTLVAATIETRVPVRGQFKALTPLAGDASNRRYFRIELTGGAAHSVILMQLAEPEAFKQSEEAVSGAAHQVTELPFLNILSHLSKAGISVPRLYHYDQAAGLLYLEDFGDLTLWEACREASAADREARYTEAVDALVHMQSTATSPADQHCLAFHRRFDVPLLMWEFEHFLEYGIVASAARRLYRTRRGADRPLDQPLSRSVGDASAGVDQPRGVPSPVRLHEHPAQPQSGGAIRLHRSRQRQSQVPRRHSACLELCQTQSPEVSRVGSAPEASHPLRAGTAMNTVRDETLSVRRWGIETPHPLPLTPHEAP